MFKVGDWVYFERYTGIITDTTTLQHPTEVDGKPGIFFKPKKITKTEKIVLEKSDYAHIGTKEDFKLWQPKEGEWCWFWNDQKDLTLQKFYKIEKSYYIVNNLEIARKNGLYFNITEKHFKNCEPFIGELPSFIKENK